MSDICQEENFILIFALRYLLVTIQILRLLNNHSYFIYYQFKHDRDLRKFAMI